MLDDLDRALFGVIGAAASDYVEGLQSPQPGQTVAHYRIVEQIGAGGMGVVCKAIDTKLDRTVALKFVQATGAGDQARLEREARAASALNHPDICTIHDFHHEGSYRFIVMEHLEGETLRDRLARGPLPEAEAIALVLRVAAALAAAHERNIVHCDVKPGNIFLTRSGAIKVLDFGIARRDGHDTTSGGRSTHGDSGVGTRAYMSPEQARGETLDARTDIYSLGALMREAIAQPGSPLAALIERMLHPDRGKRPAAMNDVIAALNAIGANRRSRRRWLTAAAAAAVAIGVTALAITRPWQGPPLLQQRDEILVGAVENRTGDPAFDDVLADTVAVQLGQSPFLRVFSDDAIGEQLTLMRRPVDAPLTAALSREICERAGLKAFVSGSITAVGAEYVIHLDAIDARTGDFITRERQQVGDVNGVLRAIGEASAAIRGVLGESVQSIERFDVPPGTATTSSLPALRAFREGEEQMALGNISRSVRAVPFFKRAIELDPEFALAYARLASAYANMNDRKQAEVAAREAFLRRERVSERERLEIAAKYYRDVSGEASKDIETLEMWARTFPDDPRPRNLLQIDLRDMGYLKESLANGEITVQLQPKSPTYRHNLIVSHMRLSAFDRAKALAEEALRDGIDTTTLHRTLRILAFLTNDHAATAREEAWIAARLSDAATGEYWAMMAAAKGRLREGRTRFEEAIRKTKQQARDNRSAGYEARLAVYEAYQGATASATRSARLALAADPSRYVAADAAFVLALTTGDMTAMSSLVEEYPEDELIKRMWLPLTQGVLELRNGRAVTAIPLLKSADRYDLGDYAALRPTYHVGEAHLALGSAEEARTAFQRIIDNRGVVATSSLYPLAHLGLARAAALAAPAKDARAAYERFFAVWPEADADMPVMAAARAEYARLK
jgi:tetratricopeptide (TPR) repeat protein